MGPAGHNSMETSTLLYPPVLCFFFPSIKDYHHFWINPPVGGDPGCLPRDPRRSLGAYGGPAARSVGSRTCRPRRLMLEASLPRGPGGHRLGLGEPQSVFQPLRKGVPGAGGGNRRRPPSTLSMFWIRHIGYGYASKDETNPEVVNRHCGLFSIRPSMHVVYLHELVVTAEFVDVLFAGIGTAEFFSECRCFCRLYKFVCENACKSNS